MKEILKKKHNKTRKKDKNDTKERETREQQRLLTKTAEISGLHFPPSCLFAFRNIRDASFDPNAAGDADAISCVSCCHRLEFLAFIIQSSERGSTSAATTVWASVETAFQLDADAFGGL